ncbi:MAG: exo-beta-N-acetylmuramidase NamZ domain-containing protein, partial [Verrucomicrobiota bacterium]
MDRRDFLHLTALGSLGAYALSGCAGGGGSVSVPSVRPAPSGGAPAGKVMLGIDVLAAEGFARLQGLRCGLVTHRAGVNGLGQRTADVLARAPGVKLLKLFGPEHGIDGVAKADVKVGHAKDARTGLPVYSLYGATRKPTPEMLAGLDAIIIDFQDIGARSYTYVSCMRLVIEACFSLPRPVRVIVLDRPNPLGGEKVDGPFLDRK